MVSPVCVREGRQAVVKAVGARERTLAGCAVARCLLVSEGTLHLQMPPSTSAAQGTQAAWPVGAATGAAACGWVQNNVEDRQAYLWPLSTGLPGLRCASRTLPVVLIFSCRPGVEAAEFRALELFAVAAVDMEGPTARG
jgi:hypothetical protein